MLVTSTNDADNDDVSDDNDYNILCILCVGDMDVLLLYTMTVLDSSAVTAVLYDRMLCVCMMRVRRIPNACHDRLHGGSGYRTQHPPV